MSQTPEKYNQRYRTEEYVYGTEPNPFIVDIAPRFIEGKTLAIAEGEGRNGVYLAGLGHDVLCWDFSQVGLDKAKKLAARHGVQMKTELVDLQTANWTPDHWDNIICVYGHFQPALRKNILQSIKSSLKIGGLFATEVYSKYQIDYSSGGPKNKENLYDPIEFLDIFGDWEIIHFFTGEVKRFEGTRHTGLCHVIQFCGRKK